PRVVFAPGFPPPDHTPGPRAPGGAPPFLNTDQAAAYLKFSSRLLKRLRRAGKGPVFRRHSRYVQYHIDDLDAWSAEQAMRGFER
ncbi:MAG: helix-turn-helix domain-containing protein, partial [Sphingomonas sp.]